MRGWTRIIVAGLAVGWLLTACAPAALPPLPPTVVPEATATLTIAPTATPTPTATAVPPTATPRPTRTPTKTAVPPTKTRTPAPAGQALPFPVNAPVGQHAYTTTLSLTTANGVTQTVTMRFLLYLPRAYEQDPAQTWPLILFLHGSGENGSNPELVAANGLPELLTGDADYPFIMVSPQAPEDAVWWGAELDRVRALLDAVQANYRVDARRVYLTGLSMGGFGAWAMAIRYPDRFAAVVPIAGGWNSENDSVPRDICVLKDVPIWVFHGAQDDIVLPKKSQLMVDALQQCGSAVQFTLYPDADHRASWALAYDDPALFEWLMAQHLP